MNQRVAAWLILILGMLFCRAWFLENVIYNIDEAEYSTAADALKQGWLPGVDLLGSTKPPGISILFRLLFDVFGRSLVPVHAAHIVILVLAGCLLVELAIALWGLAAAVPSALLFWMASNSFNIPHETIALNVESPGILFMLASLLLAWKWPKRTGLLLLSGVALGLATLFRQSLAVFMFPAIYCLWPDSKSRVKRIAVFIVGLLLPWIPVVIVYGMAGGLGWAWDSWVRYPMTYSSDTGVLGFIEALYRNATDVFLQATVPAAMAVGGAIILLQGRGREKRFVMWMLIASLLALFSGSRFFGHYWFQVYPVLALLGIPAWFALAKSNRTKRLLLGAALIVGGLVAALHFPTWRHWDKYAPSRGVSFFQLGKESLEIEIGKFVQANTNPGETITVWGYCPQIYWHADRLPGTRDYLCHYITGYSPGSFDPFTQRAFRSSGHPRAEAMFVADLEQRKPKFIVDLVQVERYTFPFLKYSIRSYPDLADYIRENYLPEGKIGDALIYRRRTSQDTWWPSQQDIE